MLTLNKLMTEETFQQIHMRSIKNLHSHIKMYKNVPSGSQIYAKKHLFKTSLTALNTSGPSSKSTIAKNTLLEYCWEYRQELARMVYSLLASLQRRQQIENCHLWIIVIIYVIRKLQWGTKVLTHFRKVAPFCIVDILITFPCLPQPLTLKINVEFWTLKSFFYFRQHWFGGSGDLWRLKGMK